MSDFFDDLERQLVAATPRRDRRLRAARLRRGAAVASVLLVLLAGGAGIAAAIGGDGGPGGGAPAATTDHFTRSTVTTPPPGPDPYSYETAVLNGTAIPGLARGVANVLINQQIRVGTVTNASRHDTRTTRVYYRTRDCLPAAQQVASALRLGDAQGKFVLRPITAAQTKLVGHGPAVVVVVGSDEHRAPGP